MPRPNRNHITVKDVAAAAGVSTQTVSRVVNRVEGVLPETRRRVEETIRRLGYRPNAIARSLTQRRTNTIGVVASGIEYFGVMSTLVGVEQKANASGYTLTLSLLAQPDTDDPSAVIHELLSRQVDGIIWATQEIGSNLAWLGQAPLPVPAVFLESYPKPGVCTVNVDSRSGARDATAHLVSTGCRRIGIIAGPLTWWCSRERLAGWRDAMRDSGLPAEDRQIVEGTWSSGSGATEMDRLFSACPDIDAVFVSNDQMALGVLRTCRRLGRRVPEDLAVVGYDDIPEAEYFSPPLTTVRQDPVRLGATAVEKLSRMIADRNRIDQIPVPSESVLLKPELVVRSSSSVRREAADGPESLPPPPE